MRMKNWGSPPRVRSRLFLGAIRVGQSGITSACAEQTNTNLDKPLDRRDHLRVCGADPSGLPVPVAPLGSPPRVRSRQPRRRQRRQPRRITSACAEQTRPWTRPPPARTDHLRVCGADSEDPSLTNGMGGSPPRVRSRLQRAGVPLVEHGITSACAEQTFSVRSGTRSSRDHLRVCGADGRSWPIR